MQTEQHANAGWDLRHRLESFPSGVDRGEILAALGWTSDDDGDHWLPPPDSARFAGSRYAFGSTPELPLSVDAAMSVIPAGWSLRDVRRDGSDHNFWLAFIEADDTKRRIRVCRGRSGSMAAAILYAVLLAVHHNRAEPAHV